jgi:hypothetical protein
MSRSCQVGFAKNNAPHPGRWGALVLSVRFGGTGQDAIDERLGWARA